jgi:Fe2+ or Zn2+ uptake regulation protein
MIRTRLKETEALMRSRGLSVTHQRMAVYRRLLEDVSHPDAERLYERVRRDVPSISLGTVYKTLDTLLDLGVITEVAAPRSATRYEAVLEAHHHLVCEDCGAIGDLYEPKYSRLRLPERSASGFEVMSCSVQFRSRCRACASRSSRRRTRRSPTELTTRRP